MAETIVAGEGTAGHSVRAAAATRRPLKGPDFFCFGAQKGGTRWLFDQLDAHPDFWMPPIKELHYFNSPSSRKRLAEKLRAQTANLDKLNRRRVRDQLRPLGAHDVDFIADFLALADRPVDHERYADLFRGKDGRLSGDITPGYSALGDARVEALVGHFTEARYLFIARDPVKRFWSQVRMHVYKKRLGRGMTDKAILKLLSHGSYRKRSFQSEIVARWRRVVPADRFGLFFFDDLVSDPVGLRQRIITFLGGDPGRPSGDLPADFNRKAGKSSAPMPEALREQVARRLADELHACADVLGGPALSWPKAYGL